MNQESPTENAFKDLVKSALNMFRRYQNELKNAEPKTRKQLNAPSEASVGKVIDGERRD